MKGYSFFEESRFKQFFHTESIIHNDRQQNHRITESQNGRGWKGPLWVI